MRQDLALVSLTSVDFENYKAHGTAIRRNAVLRLSDTEFYSAVQCLWNVSTLLLRKGSWMVSGDGSVGALGGPKSEHPNTL